MIVEPFLRSLDISKEDLFAIRGVGTSLYATKTWRSLRRTFRASSHSYFFPPTRWGVEAGRQAKLVLGCIDAEFAIRASFEFLEALAEIFTQYTPF